MIKKITVTALALLFCAVHAVMLSAQMTDDEILNYAKQALYSGKSTEDIVKDLVSKGVTVDQVRRVQNTIKGSTGTADFATTLNNVGGQARMRRLAGTMNTSTTGLENIATVFQEHSSLSDTSALMMAAYASLANQHPLAPPVVPSVVDTCAIFGHNIFKQADLTFAPNENVATPENYRLGPGDEVFIDIWGASQTTIRQTISPDGFINVENYGILPLNGMTVSEAEKYVRRQLGKIYPLSGDDPQSELKLTLGTIRTINVNVMGEVSRPGTFYLSSMSSVYHALYLAGGFTDLGSVRNISLMRKGKEIARVDIYDSLINGKTADDMILQDGDIVVVPTYDRLVTVKGNVKRPMVYEMIEGETVETVIGYAGGFRGDAYRPSLNLLRRNGRELQVYTVRESQYASFPVVDGDVMTVGEIIDRYQNRLEVKGAVYRPGTYQLSDEIDTVRELVEAADGLKGDAFRNRAIIQRELADYTLETISLNIGAVMDGSAPDLELRNNDVLYISSVHDLNDIGHITVSGEVARPGTYIYAANTTIEDAIIQAGGLLESASTAKVDVSRRIKEPSSTDISDTLSYTFTYSVKDGFMVDGEGFVLQPYDQVYVRKSPVYNVQNHVTVSGEIIFPGVYALSQRESRLSDLVRSAGGTTRWAYVKGAKLIRKMTAEEKAIAEATLEALGNAKGAIEGLVNPAQSEYTVGINLENALKNPGSDADVVLNDGDRLVIPEYTNVVRISGNVMYPNVVTYDPDMSVRKYVTMAGGYGYKAKKSKAYVVYMNGTIAKARKGGQKVIEPGCEIIVPTRITDPAVLSTIMSVVSATSSTASMLSTIYALINSTK